MQLDYRWLNFFQLFFKVFHEILHKFIFVETNRFIGNPWNKFLFKLCIIEGCFKLTGCNSNKKSTLKINILTEDQFLQKKSWFIANALLSRYSKLLLPKCLFKILSKLLIKNGALHLKNIRWRHNSKVEYPVSLSASFEYV